MPINKYRNNKNKFIINVKNVFNYVKKVTYWLRKVTFYSFFDNIKLTNNKNRLVTNNYIRRYYRIINKNKNYMQYKL